MLPYNAKHSIQQTEQIPNDPTRMGAKSNTTSNHHSISGIPRQSISEKDGTDLTFIQKRADVALSILKLRGPH